MNKDFFYEKVEGMKVTETLNIEMRPGTWKSYANIMFVYRYCLNVINLSQILCLCTGTA
jgi:hypothetical protein